MVFLWFSHKKTSRKDENQPKPPKPRSGSEAPNHHPSQASTHRAMERTGGTILEPTGAEFTRLGGLRTWGFFFVVVFFGDFTHQTDLLYKLNTTDLEDLYLKTRIYGTV